MTKTAILRKYSSVSELNELIAGRWSSRAIDPDADVSPEVMLRLFEAARWAPSAMNNQPWRFMSFGPEDPEALLKARKVLSEGNAWALAAPRLVFTLALITKVNSKDPNTRAKYETGMAAAQMALQAAQEGLVFHQMAGFDAQMLVSQFNLPAIFEPICAIAIAYPGYIENVPGNRRKYETEPRTRKALDDLVFSDGSVPAN